jgi:hemoglobin-like flavoprotein
MTPEQKRLVRDTWKQVAPVADAAAGMFYHRLFEIDPTTRKLFRATDMAAQRKKLLQTLAFAINGLDNLGALVTKVEALGRRHAGYGVTDAQYDSVGAALLWTLEQGLGHAWTPAVAAAWSEVYRLLSGIMRNAAARAERLQNVWPARLTRSFERHSAPRRGGPRGSSRRPSPRSSWSARWCCPT